MFAAQLCEWCRSRAEDFHAFNLWRSSADFFRCIFYQHIITSADDKRGQSCEGWPVMNNALINFAVDEGFAVMSCKSLKQKIVRKVCLHKHTSGQLGAASATTHLLQKLEATFSRPHIPSFKTEISINNDDESQIRKVMSLGNQLGADDEIVFAVGHIIERKLRLLPATQRIAGNHEDTGIFKAFPRFRFDAFHAGTAGSKRVSRRTMRTGRRKFFMMSAVMTEKSATTMSAPMLNQPRRTMRAGESVTAAPADGQRCVATTVKKK